MIKLFEETPKLSWFTVVIIAVGIFVVSGVPSNGNYGGKDWVAVIYHFFAFFFLALFVVIGLTQGREFKKVPVGILLVFLYACLDELHQYFVFGRSCSWFDVLVDSCGIILAASSYYLYSRLRS